MHVALWVSSPGVAWVPSPEPQVAGVPGFSVSGSPDFVLPYFPRLPQRMLPGMAKQCPARAWLVLVGGP